MEIKKTHNIIIFNPLDIAQQNLINLLFVVFKESPDKIEIFLQQKPAFWASDCYPLEIAEILKHKLIKLSNELNLNIIVKLEKAAK